MNLALVNPRVWLEIALAAVLVFGAWWAYNTVRQQGWDERDKIAVEDKARQDAQSIKNLSDAAETTKKLAATIDSQRSDFNAQMSGVTAVASRAVAGLSNRAARDSAGRVPVDPTTGAKSGATGADLLRQDSVFLTGEAARADQLRIQLAQCQAAYNAARKAVN